MSLVSSYACFLVDVFPTVQPVRTIFTELTVIIKIGMGIETYSPQEKLLFEEADWLFTYEKLYSGSYLAVLCNDIDKKRRESTKLNYQKRVFVTPFLF